MQTMYILCVSPSVNYESTSETRGPEGMLSTRNHPHFHLVDLTDQLQDIPITAVLGLLFPIDLSAIPLVSMGRSLQMDPDISACYQNSA